MTVNNCANSDTSSARFQPSWPWVQTMLSRLIALSVTLRPMAALENGPVTSPATAICQTCSTGGGGGGGKGGSGGGKQGEQKQKAGKANNFAKTLRSGIQLCQNFNRGSCGNRKGSCKHGRHFCCGQQVNGRVCGLYHPAAYCTNKKVPKF